MGSQNWSENFRTQFQKRRGYDPLKYLPAYLGLVVGGTPEITERFLWDVRQTASELVIENHAHHLRRNLRISTDSNFLWSHTISNPAG